MNEKRMQDVTNMFDRLTDEVYHGFNMRLVLTEMYNLDREAWTALQRFVDKCESERARLGL